jgi:hypothetical protein
MTFNFWAGTHKWGAAGLQFLLAVFTVFTRAVKDGLYAYEK